MKSVDLPLWHKGEEVEIEVLQHGSSQEEDDVFIHKGEGHVCPSEVIVLNVEDLLRSTPLIVAVDDREFAGLPVVGQDAAVFIGRFFFKGKKLMRIALNVHFNPLYHQTEMPVFAKILERKAVHFTGFAIDGGLLPGAAVGKHVIAMPAVVGSKVEVFAMT